MPKRNRFRGGRARKRLKFTRTRKKFGKYARKASLAKKVKAIIRKTSETKYRTLATDEGSIYYNNGNNNIIWTQGGTTSNSVWPDQGDSDLNREGDRIFATKIVSRGVFTVPDDRKNVTIKLFYVPYNSSQGNPLLKDDFYHMYLNNILISPTQFKRWPGAKLLKTYRCTPRNSSDTGAVENTINMKVTIPINKNIYFNGDSSTTPSNMKEYGVLVAWAYDTTSTNSATDIVIGKWQVAHTLYFKDL